MAKPVTHGKVVSLVLMLVILILASAVRFHQIDAQSLWHDEGVSYGLALRTLPESARHVASEVHVPLYFWGLHGWVKLTGATEFAMRMYSALFSVFSVAVAYAIGKRLFGNVAGIATAGFIALNTFSIYYAQEMRMYAMLTATAGISMWALIAFVRNPQWRWGILFAVMNVAGALQHYSYPFLMITQGVLVVIYLIGMAWQAYQSKQSYRPMVNLFGRYTAVNLLTILLYVPWILTGGPSKIGIQPNISPFVPMDELLLMIQGWLSFGRTFELSIGGMGVVIYSLLLFGLLVLPQHRKRKAWWDMLVPVLWVLIPTLLYLYLDLYARYLRFLLPAQLGFALWMGRGVWVLWNLQTRERTAPIKHIPKIAGVVATLALMLNMANGLAPLYDHPEFQRDNYRAMAERIETQAGDNDAVILDAPNQAETFFYYYTGDTPVYELPRNKDDSQTLADTQNIIGDHERLFVLFWGADEQDPNGIVENTLNNEAFQIRDEWVGDVRFVQYATPAEFTDVVDADVPFGESISLVSYALSDETFSAGDVLQLQLNWQTDAPLVTRYKVFVQLLNPDGILATQRDSEPAGGLAITTQWETDTLITDNHALVLPDTLLEGEYALIIGLYDLNDPSSRLAVGDGDFLSLGEIAIR